MSEPKFQVGQPVLLYGIGALPIVTQVLKVIGYFEVGQRLIMSTGKRIVISITGWFYETDDHYSHEQYLRPIIDPDVERETEQEEDDITA